jgi:hypothetical protein
LLDTNAHRESELRTAESSLYTGACKEFTAHKMVGHGSNDYGFYVGKGGQTINNIGNFFDISMRGMKGAYHFLMSSTWAVI